MTAPAPGLPEDVERAAFVAHMASVGVTDVAWPATLGPVGRNDDHYSVMLAVEWDRFVAGYRAAMRAATAGSGAASAASAGSAAHLRPEPGVKPESAGCGGAPRAPDSPSFDAALAALDVEPTPHPDRMVTTYAILGLDDVRAAHRREVAEQVDAIRKERDEARGDARGNYLNILEVTALARTGTGPVKYADPVLEDAAAAVRVLLQERAAHAEAVRVAVEAERELCERLLERRISDCDYLAGNAERGGNVLVRNEWEAKAAELRSALCAIRARGVAKPRTDGEAATRSGEGAKS